MTYHKAQAKARTSNMLCECGICIKFIKHIAIPKKKVRDPVFKPTVTNSSPGMVFLQCESTYASQVVVRF